jgi:predicted DNA-binding transcriptional regulator YafY
MSETELNKAQKFVCMVQAIARRGGASTHDLMARFDLDPRTLRRYLADLRACGLPIQDTQERGARVISLDASWARSAVQLTVMEVLALHFGRSMLAFLDGTAFADQMEDALERLSPVIGRRETEIAKDLDRRFLAVAEHAKDHRREADTLDELITALIYCNPTDVEYVPHGEVGRTYRLEPLTLAVYRHGLYLFARDVNRDRIRIFAVERFSRVSRLRRETFAYPADYHPRDVIRHAFGIFSGDPSDVTVRFSARVAPYVRERKWHDSQSLDLLDDGGVRLRMQVTIAPDLLQWLLGFGADARVEGPEELVERVREEHRRAAARYEEA